MKLAILTLFSAAAFGQIGQPAFFTNTQPGGLCSLGYPPLIWQTLIPTMWVCGPDSQYHQISATSTTSSPAVVSTWYNFPPQFPGGSLTGGTPATINLTPVPLGVNGSNAGYSVLLSGGSGTSEACKVTGGTAVSGATAGTIICTPIFSHSGAFSVSSASGGAAEALAVTGAAGGGTVIVPPGTISLYGLVNIPSKTCLVGQGPSSILQVANNQFGNTAAWQWSGSGTAGIVGGLFTNNICIRNLAVDWNGTNQSLTGITTGLAAAIILTGSSDSVIDNVTVRNDPVNLSVATVGVLLWIGSNHNVVSNSFFYGSVCTTSGGIEAGMQDVSITGTGNRVIDNYGSNGCEGGFGTGGGTDNDFIGNYYEIGSSTALFGTQTFWSDSSFGTRFIANTCSGANLACFAAITDSGTTQNTTFEGNVAKNCGDGYEISASGGSSIFGTVIHGGYVSNCTNPILVAATGGGIAPDVAVKDVIGVSADTPGLVTFSPSNENFVTGGKNIILASASGAFSVGGFTGGFEGRQLTIINSSGQAMTINNNDGGSSPGNRICTPTGANVTLPTRNSIAMFQFSALSNNCWWFVSTN